MKIKISILKQLGLLSLISNLFDIQAFGEKVSYKEVPNSSVAVLLKTYSCNDVDVTSHYYCNIIMYKSGLYLRNEPNGDIYQDLPQNLVKPEQVQRPTQFLDPDLDELEQVIIEKLRDKERTRAKDELNELKKLTQVLKELREKDYSYSSLMDEQVVLKERIKKFKNGMVEQDGLRELTKLITELRDKAPTFEMVAKNFDVEQQRESDKPRMEVAGAGLMLSAKKRRESEAPTHAYTVLPNSPISNSNFIPPTLYSTDSNGAYIDEYMRIQSNESSSAIYGFKIFENTITNKPAVLVEVKECGDFGPGWGWYGKCTLIIDSDGTIYKTNFGKENLFPFPSGNATITLTKNESTDPYNQNFVVNVYDSAGGNRTASFYKYPGEYNNFIINGYKPKFFLNF